MRRILLAVAAGVILSGVGLGLFFGLTGSEGGGSVSGEPFVVPTYPPPEAMLEWTCDDWREVTNPEGTEEFPSVVAVVEAPDLQIRLQVTGRYLVSHMIAKEKDGDPFSDEKAALRDIEDGQILYIAAVRDGLGVSEEEARAAVASQTPDPCGAWEDVSESERILSKQFLRTTSKMVRKLLEERKPGEDIYQMMASRIAEERPNVRITEVSFGEDRELVCTKEDEEVTCPSDLPTPEPTAEPTQEPTAERTATPRPTLEPTPEPTAEPTPEPTAAP